MCKNCGNRSLFSDNVTGDIICANCGLILESNQIDCGAEWRTFDNGDFEKRTRVGPPSTLMLHDKGLSTYN